MSFRYIPGKQRSSDSVLHRGHIAIYTLYMWKLRNTLCIGEGVWRDAAGLTVRFIEPLGNMWSKDGYNTANFPDFGVSQARVDGGAW